MARILSIEDDGEMSMLVEMILTRNGHEVARAASGLQGMRLIESFQPDLILLDLMMPDVDGWDVYRFVKDKVPHIPVIIVTARAHSAEKQVALHISQVDDYITKPFTPQQLVESVDRALAAQT
jgi:DNA-binding response OmpR family regulator